jgi:acyl-CoA reductase-like NAD-dependent aldehyde dehydrogenase
MDTAWRVFSLAPVCKVRVDEAIALANDSQLGLGANLYTNDLDRRCVA